MTRSNPIQFSTKQRVTLPFRARWAYIDNPTANTVMVREGNTDQPANLAEADWWVPALGARVMPCNASEFGLGVGAPFAANQPGLPAVALAIFGDASEPMPSIGSEAALSLASVEAAERSLFLNPSGQAANFYSVFVPLPSDIKTVRAVSFQRTGTTDGIDDFFIVGSDSGITYGDYNPINDAATLKVLTRIFRVYPSRDSQLEVDYNVIGAGGKSLWRLLGFTGIDHGAWNTAGEQYIQQHA